MLLNWQVLQIYWLSVLISIYRATGLSSSWKTLSSDCSIVYELSYAALQTPKRRVYESNGTHSQTRRLGVGNHDTTTLQVENIPKWETRDSDFPMFGAFQ